MLTSVYRFVARRIFGELPFKQALYDYRGYRDRVGGSVVGRVNSCALLMYGDSGRSFPLTGKVPQWTEVKFVCQKY